MSIHAISIIIQSLYIAVPQYVVKNGRKNSSLLLYFSSFMVALYNKLKN